MGKYPAEEDQLRSVTLAGPLLINLLMRAALSRFCTVCFRPASFYCRLLFHAHFWDVSAGSDEVCRIVIIFQ